MAGTVNLPVTAPVPATPLVRPFRVILDGIEAQELMPVLIAIDRVGAETPAILTEVKLKFKEGGSIRDTGIVYHTHTYAKICFLLPNNPLVGEPKG